LNNLVNDNIDLSWVPEFNEAPTKEDDDEDDIISNLNDMFRGDHEDFFKKIFKLEDLVQEGDNNKIKNSDEDEDEDRTKFFAIILKNILDESDINKEKFNTEFSNGNYDGAIKGSGCNILENKMDIVKLLDISNLIPLSENRTKTNVFTKENICKHMNCD